MLWKFLYWSLIIFSGTGMLMVAIFLRLGPLEHKRVDRWVSFIMLILAAILIFMATKLPTGA